MSAGFRWTLQCSTCHRVSLLTPLVSPVVNTQQMLPSLTLTPGVAVLIKYFTRPGRAHVELEKALTVAHFDLKFKNITLSMQLCLVNLSRCTVSCLENTSVLFFGFIIAASSRLAQQQLKAWTLHFAALVHVRQVEETCHVIRGERRPLKV